MGRGMSFGNTPIARQIRALRKKKVRTDRPEKRARQEPVPPPHAVLLPEGTARRPRPTPAEKAARELIVQAVRDITFVHAAISTELVIEPDGFHVSLVIFDRETGEPCAIDLRWDLPPFLLSHEHAIDWIYTCVREAWVHELNEALFVDGIRRRNLHNDRGQTILPPDEVASSDLNTFKIQLAAFLMGAPR